MLKYESCLADFRCALIFIGSNKIYKYSGRFGAFAYRSAAPGGTRRNEEVLKNRNKYTIRGSTADIPVDGDNIGPFDDLQ